MSLADQFAADVATASSAPPAAAPVPLSAQFAADVSLPPVVAAKATSAPDRDWGAEALRQVGLTARAGITGLTGIPAMFGDAANTGINMASHGINALAGTHIPDLQLPSAEIQRGENAVGLPQPHGALENAVQSGAAGMAGGGSSVALGRMLAGYAAPGVSAVGGGLAAAPGMQIVGGAGAGAAGSAAASAGLGPAAQLGAALLGGGATVAGASGVTAGLRGAASIPSAVAEARAPAANPTGYVGRFLANGAADPVAAAAATADPAILVPGSYPRTSMVAGDPRVVQMEKAFANDNGDFKTAIINNDNASNAARWAHLNSVAQTPEALDAAIAARKQAMQPMVDAVLNNGAPVPAGPILAHVEKLQNSSFGTDPIIAKGLSDVKSAILGRSTQDGGAPAATSPILGANGQPLATAPSTPKGPLMIRPDLADGIRQNLSSFIADNSSNGAVSSKQEAGLLPLKSTITEAITATNPKYPDYLAEYAKQSAPINTMQAAQNIAEALRGKGVDAAQVPVMTLAGYSGQLAKALKNSEYGIEPEAHAKLQAIQADLQRATAANSVKSAGSDTAYNLTSKGWLAKGLYGDKYEGGTIGKALGGALGGVGAAGGAVLFGPGGAGVGSSLGQALGSGLSGLGTKVGGGLESTLAGALMDPQKYNRALGAALKNR